MVAGIGALAVCVAYALGVRTLAPEFAPGVVEFVGTATSLWCVWITRRQNVLSIPIGIVSVVAASVIAHLLLMAKKVESWWLWIGPVNVSAIGLHLVTGAYMFAALYVVFLVNAFVGHAQWQTARRLAGTRVLAPADR